MKKTNNLPFEIRRKGTSNEELAASLAEKANQADLGSTNSRIDNLVLNNGSSSAEVIDARIDSKGNIFPSIKDRVNNIEKIITDGSSSLPVESFGWEQGNIYSSGLNAPSNNTYYPMSIRTSGYINLTTETLNATVTNGYTVDVFKYNGTTFVSFTRYSSDFSFVPESGMSYRFCIGYTANITVQQGLSALKINKEYLTFNGSKIKVLESNSAKLTNNNFENSYNEFDPSNLLNGYLYDTNTVANNSSYSYDPDYQPASEGFYQINYAKVLFYDSSKTVIKYVNSFELYETVTSTPANTAFMRISVNKANIAKSMVRKVDLCKYREFKPYGLVPTDKEVWKGKTGLFYGDSITAQSSPDLFGGYCGWVTNYLKLGSAYVRGVGGQTYFWNTNTFFANADGSYNSRGGTQPAGTTQAKGCFCSWERIKTMIPTSIKDTIDIIFVMGGTNDLSNAEEATGSGVIEYAVPVWSSANTTDPEWVADTTNYNGGDYNLSTFSGAIASTIMKLQTWCPKAVIVILTPWSRWDTTTKAQFVNSNGKTMRDVAEAEIKTAEYMSCERIDVNAKCGVNAFNYSSYVTDGIHPANDSARRKLARAVVGGMKTVYPSL
ncbi:GDSL-type esterase/lipase family protein [Neobacillus vireti]|uniref:GDSL-type esterase/lipase family protein n=1 Tax=Neobacillus vireti TaxID=220686 RepID=UPI0030004694